MHKPESVIENETHKILWHFEMQADHRISARRPILVMINKGKRTFHQVDYVIPADQRAKIKESEKKDKYLDISRK